MYLYYGQTPELKALPSKTDRDSVHAQAWRHLRHQRPRLWLRSFVVVMLFAFTGAAAGEALANAGGLLNSEASISLGAAVGSAFGAVLHIHSTASALRPVYAEIVAQRQEPGA